MNQHERDLISQLFTLATCILEDTHIPVSHGQSIRLGPNDYRRALRKLTGAANDLAAIAGAIRAVLAQRPVPILRKPRSKSTRGK